MKLKYGRVVPRKTTEDNESRETLVNRGRLEIKRRLDNCLKKECCHLALRRRVSAAPKTVSGLAPEVESGLVGIRQRWYLSAAVRLQRTVLRASGVVFSEITPLIQVIGLPFWLRW